MSKYREIETNVREKLGWDDVRIARSRLCDMKTALKEYESMQSKNIPKIKIISTSSEGFIEGAKTTPCRQKEFIGSPLLNRSEKISNHSPLESFDGAKKTIFDLSDRILAIEQKIKRKKTFVSEKQDSCKVGLYMIEKSIQIDMGHIHSLQQLQKNAIEKIENSIQDKKQILHLIDMEDYKDNIDLLKNYKDYCSEVNLMSDFIHSHNNS